jgi:hypothetical protein
MRGGAWAAAVLLAGCGRFGFGTYGGTSADGRPGDGRVPDVPPDAFVCRFQLCDGFEDTTFQSLWTVDVGITRDTTTSHGGAASVHFHSSALNVGQGGYFTLSETQTLPLGDPTFYVRAWVKLASLPAGSNGMELLSADETTGPGYGNDVFLKSGVMDVYEQFTDQVQATSGPPPLNTWFCALWTVVRDSGSAGSLTLAGDVGPITLPSVPTDGTPAISVMSFGIGYAGPNVNVAQPAMDIWMDDLIVHNAPVTCSD